MNLCARMGNHLPLLSLLLLLHLLILAPASSLAASSSVSSGSSSAGPGLRVLVPLKVGFQQFVSWQKTSDAPNATAAYKFNGFSVQVFLQALNRLPHPPTFHFVPFGDGKSTPSYNAMVDLVQRGDADAIVGDITITKARMEKVDFTMPYIKSSLVMVTTFRYGSAGTMWDFLHPFSWQLWLAVAMSFASTGLVLCFLERHNPEFSKHAPSLPTRIQQEGHDPKTKGVAALGTSPPCSTSFRSDDHHPHYCCIHAHRHPGSHPPVDSLQSARIQSPISDVSLKHLLLNSYWFTSLCVFAAQQESVRTHCGRIVTVVWLFVMLIFNSSYTASLASLLSAQQPYPKMQSFEALLRSNAAVGYLEGSSVETYLKMLGFASNRLHKYSSEVDYAQALRNSTGGVAAILDESPYTDILPRSECDFTSVGDQIAYFGGFGFAFAKNSSLTDEVSKGILSLAEDGVMHRLRNGFLQGTTSQCSSGSSFRSFVGLFSSLAAVYAMCVLWRVFGNAFRRAMHTRALSPGPRQDCRVGGETPITQEPVHPPQPTNLVVPPISP